MTLAHPRETTMIVNWLKARTGGSVPVSTRLPKLDGTAGRSLPWVVVTVVSNPHVGGDIPGTVTTVQIDCYGDDLADANDLADTIRDVIESERGWDDPTWGRVAGGPVLMGSVPAPDLEVGVGRFVVTCQILALPRTVDDEYGG